MGPKSRRPSGFDLFRRVISPDVRAARRENPDSETSFMQECSNRWQKISASERSSYNREARGLKRSQQDPQFVPIGNAYSALRHILILTLAKRSKNDY